MDKESWYSVTPEGIARGIAERCRCDLIVDGFCGVGGNAIQFAMTCERVIAIDIDPEKIRRARSNARVYGVEDRIEFIVGDFFKVVPNLRRAVDVVFLSPPWGGPGYLTNEIYDIRKMDGVKIFGAARQITEHIAYYVPRNVDVNQMAALAGPGGHVKLQKNLLNGWPNAITAYYNMAMLERGTTILASPPKTEPNDRLRFCPYRDCKRTFSTQCETVQHYRDNHVLR